MGTFLKDKVAVVTGSGSGIGRAIALLMAEEGARVVVNDLGCGTDGTGASGASADQVVAEITRRGGVAVASYDTVATMAGGQRIIMTAVDSFGRIDILVNNAGITRNGMLVDMTEEDWDLVVAVHLKGHFACSKPAAISMIKQRSGRIINISSGAALGVAVGNVNYSAAKAGILGFTRTLARELGPHGITVNAVLPVAYTRMMARALEERKSSMAPDISVSQTPEEVAPLVAYLASDQAGDINGCTLAARHKGTVQLYSDPLPLRSIYRDGGWTLNALSSVIPVSLAAGLVNPASPLR